MGMLFILPGMLRSFGIAWAEMAFAEKYARDYVPITIVAGKIPEIFLQKDTKLLMGSDRAETRTGETERRNNNAGIT